MTTMFVDTNGDMSFVDNERLKFIMHYLKQGANDSLVEMKDGRFVREDSELSFTEIWLPSAEHQQRKIDEQQSKVEELQKQFDQHDKLLLQRNKDVQELYDINVKHAAEKEELQKRVDQQGLIIAKAMSIASDLQKSWSMFEIGKKLEQVLKGEG